MPASDTDSARPPRRWWRPQFGLRALLVLVSIAAVGLAGLQWRIARARKQREVVETLLRRGATIRYDDAKGGVQWDEPAYFWRDAHFYRNVLSLEVNSDATTIQGIAWLPRLESLEISLDTPLPRLASRHGIKKLVIVGRKLSPADLAEVGACRRLTSLSIEVDGNSQPGLVHLGGLSRLAALTIEGPVEASSAAEWKQLTNLEQLTATGSVPGQEFGALARANPRLQDVTLPVVGDAKELCEGLATCRQLTHVTLLGEIDDEAIVPLRSLPALNVLNLPQTNVTGTCFDGTNSFPSLQHLNLTHSAVDDRGAFLIGRLPSVRFIDLRSTRITDEACSYLAHCPLVTAWLANTSLTDLGVRRLRGGTIADLTLEGTSVSARAFDSPSQWPNLKWLELGNGPTTESDLERLLSIPSLEIVFADATVSPEFVERHRKRLFLRQPVGPPASAPSSALSPGP